MEKPDDIGRRINAHLKSPFGRVFQWTSREVRESITASLMGIRTHLQAKEPLPRAEAAYQRQRCEQVHEQVRTLIARGDRHHAKNLRRVLRSYERRLDAMLGYGNVEGDQKHAEESE